jgi:hypothetical protein
METVKKAKGKSENHKGKLPVSGFIPEQIAKKARAYCDERGESMPTILGEALEGYLKNPPKIAKKEKVAKKAKEEKTEKAA